MKMTSFTTRDFHETAKWYENVGTVSGFRGRSESVPEKRHSFVYKTGVLFSKLFVRAVRRGTRLNDFARLPIIGRGDILPAPGAAKLVSVMKLLFCRPRGKVDLTSTRMSVSRLP